jgi:type II secretory pathway component PulM
MKAQLVGITDKSDRFPQRGERIARWLETYMDARGLSVAEIAFRVKADKRDIRRLLNERSCGPRLNDDLEAAFGWDFIEHVATPVVGADPLTAREREVEQRLAEAAAIQARLERDRASRAARRAGLEHVEGQAALRSVPARVESRAFDQPPPVRA